MAVQPAEAFGADGRADFGGRRRVGVQGTSPCGDAPRELALDAFSAAHVAGRARAGAGSGLSRR